MVESVFFDRLKWQDIDTGIHSREVRLQDGRVITMDQVGLHKWLADMTQAHMVEEFGSIAHSVEALSPAPSELWVTKPEVVDATLTIPPTTVVRVFRGGSITVTAGTLTLGNVEAGNFGWLFTSGSGTISCETQVLINPVWFTTGLGTLVSPWTSTDGTAGWQGAFTALQNGGAIAAPGGRYSVTATANLNRSDVSITLSPRAVITPTGNICIFDLNATAYAANGLENTPTTPTTVRNNILFRGGFLDVGLPGVVTVPTATGIRAARVRYLTVQDVHFRRLATAIWAPISDTCAIFHNFFEGCNTAILLPNFNTNQGATPQDIWISENSFSTDDFVLTHIAIDVQSVVDSLLITRNNWARRIDTVGRIGKFVQLVTGARDALDGVTDRESSNVRIELNATEQADSQTLIHLYDTGHSLNLRNLIIRGNALSSNLAKCIDVSRVEGYVAIVNNDFPVSNQWAIDLDQVRQDCLVEIHGNFFAQLAATSGTILEITNVITTGRVVIGANSYALDVGTIGAIRYHINGTVVWLPARGWPSSNYTAAATVVVYPWHKIIPIAGAGTVDKLISFGLDSVTALAHVAPWKGQEMLVQLGTGVTLRDNSAAAGNCLLMGDVNIVGGTNVFVPLLSNGINCIQVGPDNV
jgi:hypothetical protein